MSLLRLARRPAISVAEDATVRDAIKTMVEHSVGAVAVTREGKLAGIFTERDVMKKIVMAGKDIDQTRMRDVMTSEIKKVSSTTPVDEALSLMSQHRIRHLPVVGPDGDLQGMISLRYLLHDRLDDLLDQLKTLETMMTADGPGG